METKRLPKLYILTDPDFVHGIEKGFYNEYKHALEVGDIKFITKSKAMELRDKGEIDKISKPEGVYILNPYDQMYMELSIDNIQNIDRNFIESKASAYKNAMHKMGAHCIILSEEVTDINQEKGGVNVNGGDITSGIRGGVDVNYQTDVSVNLKTIIQEYYPHNTPLEIEKVEHFLIERHLRQDCYLNSIFEQFQEEKRLRGCRVIEINFRQELKSAIDVALGINYGPVGINMGFSHKNLHIHEFKRSLKVFFDDVPPNVVKKFEQIP